MNMIGEGGHIRKFSLPLLVWGLALFLTLASFGVIIHNACTEPFVAVRTGEALIQVGLSCALLLLWAQLALGIVIGMAGRRLSLWFALVLLWGCFVCYGNAVCIFGYIHDVQSFTRPGTVIVD